MSAWALYSLIPGAPVLATSSEGVLVGVWIRRFIPWRNIKAIYLPEVRMDGGLKKWWGAGGPYNQRIIIELNTSADLSFENWAHGVAYFISGSRKDIELETKLVTNVPKLTMCDQLVER
ncbi:hypothetical protein [uncultured Pseudodesulfovibrio sp.]|uniref:hypothetical protein n=1 Tax=uncultured Pseudodesulfovibrio sp. TaxID=2035858 RepID=UPI0029C9328E|nr:hypothetical protein [uncultured Pseudodesulfovibrio sp.]